MTETVLPLNETEMERVTDFVFALHRWSSGEKSVDTCETLASAYGKVAGLISRAGISAEEAVRLTGAQSQPTQALSSHLFTCEMLRLDWIGPKTMFETPMLSQATFLEGLRNFENDYLHKFRTCPPALKPMEANAITAPQLREELERLMLEKLEEHKIKALEAESKAVELFKKTFRALNKMLKNTTGLDAPLDFSVMKSQYDLAAAIVLANGTTTPEDHEFFKRWFGQDTSSFSTEKMVQPLTEMLSRQGIKAKSQMRVLEKVRAIIAQNSPKYLQ